MTINHFQVTIVKKEVMIMDIRQAIQIIMDPHTEGIVESKLENGAGLGIWLF